METVSAPNAWCVCTRNECGLTDGRLVPLARHGLPEGIKHALGLPRHADADALGALRRILERQDLALLAPLRIHVRKVGRRSGCGLLHAQNPLGSVTVVHASASRNVDARHTALKTTFDSP